MRRLCHPQASIAPSSFKDCAIDDRFLPTEHAMLVRLFGDLCSTNFGRAIEEEVDRNEEHSMVDNEVIMLSGKLQSNVIIEGCTDFLDSQSLS